MRSLISIFALLFGLTAALAQPSTTNGPLNLLNSMGSAGANQLPFSSGTAGNPPAWGNLSTLIVGGAGIGTTGTTTVTINCDIATVSINGCVHPDGTTITVNGSGVISAVGAISSVTGTSGQITASPTTGAVVLTLPATITSNETFSGTVNLTGTAELSGTPFGTFATANYAAPPVIGGVTPAAGTFTTLTSTGATVVGTTLGVTGATTLSSTLGVTGNATLNGTLTASGLLASGSITIASSLCADSSGKIATAAGGNCYGGGGGGSVSSVALATPNSTLTLGGTNPVTGSGTINADINLSNANLWAAAQTFTNGDLLLKGSSSGNTTLEAPATGGGVATFFAGADTVVGLAATQTLTNKTLTSPTLGGTVAGNVTVSGNNIYSGTATFTGGAPSLSNGKAAIFASSTLGGILIGQGSTNDVEIQNSGGASVCAVATSATTLNCTGLQVAGDTATTNTATQTITNKSIAASEINSGTLALAQGGTNAGLTASNGGILYSGASAFAVLAGTATAGLPLLSGSSGAPSWGADANLAYLDANQVFTASQRVTLSTITISTATFTPNFNTGADFSVTLVHASCPCTLANPSTTPVAGQHGVIYVTQSSTGSDTIGTWGSDYVYSGGTSTIALSAGANDIDVLSYAVKDSTHIVLAIAGLNVSH